MKKITSCFVLCVVLICLASGSFSQNTTTTDSTNTGTTSQASNSGYTVPQSYYNSIASQGAQNPYAPTLVAQNTTPSTASSTAAPTTVTTESSPPTATASPKKIRSAAPASNTSYLSTEITNLRSEIETLKAAQAAKPEPNKNVGYKGGFFINSDDGKFKLKINGKTELVYDVASVERQENAHGGKPGIKIAFAGNTFSEKLVYALAINPFSIYQKKISVDFSKPDKEEKFSKNIDTKTVANGFDLGYKISPLLEVHVQRDFVFTDEAGADFLLDSYGSARYPAPVMDLKLNGTYKKLGYFLAVFQRADAAWNLPTVNNELGYAARLDYNIITGTETRPAFDAAIVGNLFHNETGTEARVIMAGANLRFNYKRFSLGVEGTWHQLDPDQYTESLEDGVFMGWAGYYLVPDKLLLATRFSMTFDDLSGSGTGLDNLETQLNANVFSDTINPQARVGDSGDAANEWEASVQLSYFPFASSKVAVKGQYMYVNDNTTDGTDPIQSHIIETLVSVGF